MRVLLLIVVAMSAISLGFSADAHKAPAKVKYKKNMNMEFDGRSVDGNVVSPDSADIEGDKNIKFAPLFEGRKDFKREFKRSSGANQ